jgi:hypothetical protein
VTSKSFLLFTKAPIVLACTRSEETATACTRVLTSQQAGNYGLNPYEDWLEAGASLGENDAWDDRACRPEDACVEAAAEGSGALAGCLEGYRAAFDENTYGDACPEASSPAP